MRRTKRKRGGYDVDITKSTLYGSGLLDDFFGSTDEPKPEPKKSPVDPKILEGYHRDIRNKVNEIWTAFLAEYKKNNPAKTIEISPIKVEITKLAPGDISDNGISDKESLSGLSESLFSIYPKMKIYEKMKTNLQPLLNDDNGTNIKLRFVKLINYYLNQTKRLIGRKEKINRKLFTKIEKKKNEVNAKKEEINKINEPALDESGDSNQAGGEEENAEEPLNEEAKEEKNAEEPPKEEAKEEKKETPTGEDAKKETLTGEDAKKDVPDEEDAEKANKKAEEEEEAAKKKAKEEEEEAKKKAEEEAEKAKKEKESK